MFLSHIINFKIIGLCVQYITHDLNPKSYKQFVLLTQLQSVHRGTCLNRIYYNRDNDNGCERQIP